MIKYRILPEDRLIVLCFWGEVDEEEVLALSSDLRNDPEFSTRYDALVDTSDLQHSVSSAEVRDLAEPRITMSANARLAVVAPADFSYGPSRMHQLLSEQRTPMHIEVFRERESAIAWLGKDGLNLQQLCDELAAECTTPRQ